MVLLIILCVILMWLSKNTDTKEYYLKIRDVIGGATVNHLREFVHYGTKTITRSKEKAKQADIENLPEKYAKLTEEKKRLTQEKLALELEVKNFRKLLGLKDKIKEKLVLAEIYQVTLNPYKFNIMINVGRQNCIGEDMVLIDANGGVLGQVIDVAKDSSTVRLLTDQSHVMSVQFKDTGLITLAYGTGESKLRLPYLSPSTEVSVGQDIISSGRDRIYPAGQMVGKVTEVNTTPGGKYKVAYVKPTAHLDYSRDAFVVLTAEKLNEERNKHKATGTKDACQ